ncbi:MAG: hypothetical protein QHJ34_08610 [bacterium]|jgi:lipopolysaccharide export system protein LptA|nr:hypothetical protein [candidate division KSB1 bacterium]MDH7560274.1 hypothetical protein [bacterium]
MKTGVVGRDGARLTVFVGVVLFACVCLRARAQDERLRLIRAARLSGQTVEGRILQRLEGDVLFRQGRATMSCEQALRDEAAGTVVFIGRVRIDTGRRRLYAARVAYNEFSRVEEAEGHPVVYDSTRRLAAERLTYFEPEERALASGRVILADTARFTTLTCGRLEYFRATGYGVATDSPRLVKTDSTGGDSLVLLGDKMEVFDAGARALVTDSVTLSKGRLLVSCGRAEYFDDEQKVVLTASPHGVYGQDHLRGTTMEVFLNGQAVRTIVVQGEALITSPSDSLNPEARVNRLTGQRVTIQLVEEQVREMTIEEQATSLYHVVEEGEFKGVNLISGDRILLYLEDGKLRRVRIESAPGKTSGVFYPPRLEGSIPAGNGQGTRRATG